MRHSNAPVSRFQSRKRPKIDSIHRKLHKMMAAISTTTKFIQHIQSPSKIFQNDLESIPNPSKSHRIRLFFRPISPAMAVASLRGAGGLAWRLGGVARGPLKRRAFAAAANPCPDDQLIHLPSCKHTKNYGKIHHV